MRELAEHLLTPILSEPDALSLQVVEGESSILLEAVVSDADRAALEDDDERLLRSVRIILSAAAGRRKASIDLVDALGEDDGEE